MAGACLPAPAQTNSTAVSTNTAPAAPAPLPHTPREFFNAGTQQFRAGKLKEAEAALQIAVASNRERIQPPALYNLGHVRFEQGAEALKQAADAPATRQRADAATAWGADALRAADAALASDNLSEIISAYIQGRGAKKELKAATEAVKKAMETYGAVLTRWQRSSGDFKSALELEPSRTDAQFNAEVVDRNIAALIDKQAMMKQAGQGAGDKLDQLKEKMKQLKGKIPDGELPGAPGDDEEEEDDGDQPKEPQKQDGPGREREAKQGLQILITEEEALRLLESFQLDANRKLPMGGEGDPGKPVDRKGRDW
jgi:Tfp pilus assembly protein PilF